MHVLDNKPTKQIVEMEFLDTPFLRAGKKKKYTSLAESASQRFEGFESPPTQRCPEKESIFPIL